jgi:hypothetical protein
MDISSSERLVYLPKTVARCEELEAVLAAKLFE